MLAEPVSRVVDGDLRVRKPYVAIVDDDSAFAAYLRTFLALRGYEARCYTRGDEMLASIKAGDQPDVVVLDVMMPGLDGLETLRALKAARPEMQAVMLSGRQQASVIVEAVKLGATDYVIKPDDPEGLGEIALDVAIKNAIEKNRLVSELTELRQQLSDEQDRAFLFWGNSEQMRIVASVVEQVADSDVTVLIRGESGVGKELVSRAIHQRSPRRTQPLVRVNCAALPAELLESELFGHEKGAFTGAATTRIGKFEQADGGTLMLDEIAEMTAALQAKLLHVLQDGEFTRLGSNKRMTVDVRVLAATNRDLEAMMLRGRFREDLYYRLKVIEVMVPALRDRRDEIAPLTDFFIAKYAHKYNRQARPPSENLRRIFQQYHWPGNVRELENVIKRVVILQDEDLVIKEIQHGIEKAIPTADSPASRGPAVATATPPAASPEPAPEPAPAVEAAPHTAHPEPRKLAEVARAASMQAERVAIEEALKKLHWNRRKAAVALGVSYKTLLNKIKECGISRD
jgi:DNA-binding NtrC family response regulator